MHVTGATAVSIPGIWKDSIIATVKDGKLFRVKKFNPTSLILTDADGKEYRFSTKQDSQWKAIREATEEERDRFVSAEFSQTVFYRVGNVVRWPECTHPMGKGLLVVTKVNADGDCNLVPLGGNVTLEYFRSVPWSKLEKVDGEVAVKNA